MSHIFTPPQRRFQPRSPLHRAPQGRRLDAQRFLALQHRSQLRSALLRTSLDAHRLTAVANSALLTAAWTNDIIAVQSQRPAPPAARRAPKPTPRTAGPELAQMDAHILLDVAELDAECCSLGGDDIQRSKARDGNRRQVVAVNAVSGYLSHNKLDTSLRLPNANMAPSWTTAPRSGREAGTKSFQRLRQIEHKNDIRIYRYFFSTTTTTTSLRQVSAALGLFYSDGPPGPPMDH